MHIALSSDLADFADVWPALDQEGPHRAYVFQSRDLIEVWLKTIGVARGTHPLFVLVSRDDGSPLMLMPLGVEHRHGVRIIGFLDGGVSDYNSPILFPGAEHIDADTMRQLWIRMQAELPAFDLAIFEKIPAVVEDLRNPFQALTQAPDSTSGHLVRLGNSYERPRSRHERRKMRKLETAAANVELLLAETPADITRVLEAMIEQKTRRYLETRGVDGFNRPGYRAYYQAMTDRFALSGHVQLSAIVANDNVIASHWGIVARSRYYRLMAAFAADWAQYSPGMLQMGQLIDWCCSRGIATLDLGTGDQAHKLRYANERLPLLAGRHASTLKGRAYLAGLLMRRRLSASRTGDMWRAFMRLRGKRRSGLEPASSRGATGSSRQARR